MVSELARGPASPRAGVKTVEYGVALSGVSGHEGLPNWHGYVSVAK